MDHEGSVFEDAACFAAVALGVLVSLGLASWALLAMQQLLVGAMVMSPLALLVLIGRVVKERALRDWYGHRSLPLLVRLARAFVIGLVWPIWLKQRGY